jgi:hypothetical protein
MLFFSLQPTGRLRDGARRSSRHVPDRVCHDDVVFTVSVSKLVMAAACLDERPALGLEPPDALLLSRSSSGLFAMDGTRRANTALDV